MAVTNLRVKRGFDEPYTGHPEETRNRDPDQLDQGDVIDNPTRRPDARRRLEETMQIATGRGDQRFAERQNVEHGRRGMGWFAGIAAGHSDNSNATRVFAEPDRNVRVLAEEAPGQRDARGTGEGPGCVCGRNMDSQRDARPVGIVHDGSVPEGARRSDLATTAGHAGAVDAGGEAVGPDPGAAADRHAG